MQKQAPSAGRILVMVAFALSCFGLLLYLWLAFGGSVPLKPKGYRFEVAFKEAGQLAQEADVRISGVSVGKVKKIESDGATGLSDATVELKPRYAPIPKDTKAILRQKTLLGETYVELTPGDKGGGTVPENGRLPAGSVSPTVELDEIFRAFDEKTRASFRTWMAQLALASQGRGRDISDAIGNLAPFAEETDRLLKILDAQDATVRSLVANTGEVFTALSERDGQLRGLIENADRVFSTTAARDRELADTFRALPTFEREATLTVRRLAEFSRRTDPLVTQLRPAARELSPTLVQLAGLAPDLEALFRDLDPLITASERGLPALERFLDQLRPVLGELDPALRQLNPVLEYVGRHQGELSAFFANVVASTQAVTGSGADAVHYLRTTNPLNPENLAVYPRRLPTNRTNPYASPTAFRGLRDGLASYETRHCAGALPALVTAPTPGQPDPTELISPRLADLITQFAFNSGNGVPAPSCRQQGPFTSGGETTQFPHVPAATGPTARAAGR